MMMMMGFPIGKIGRCFVLFEFLNFEFLKFEFLKIEFVNMQKQYQERPGMFLSLF